MLRRALAGVERACVWTEEIERAGRSGDDASYWVDTLRAARAAAGEGARLRFLIGADPALAFHRWREPRGILRLAEPVVVLREPVGTTGALARGMEATGFWSAEEVARWGGAAVVLPLVDVSSTAVRAALARGEEPAGLAPAVAAFVRERGLYQSD
jgi:nicotinate-nucleotide adenylyltransferase